MTQPPSPSAAKPAASDDAIALEIAKFAKETVFVFDDDLARIAKCIVAALAERGRVERERAAQIAEHIQELEDVALGIPAAIRNQTLTGD